MGDVTVRDAFAEWVRARSAGGTMSKATLAGYRSDVSAISVILCRNLGRDVDGDAASHLVVTDLTTRNLRDAFADYAADHARATLARAQATWRGLSAFCTQEDWLPGDPMAGVVRVKMPKRLPKPLQGGDDTMRVLLEFLSSHGRTGRDPWKERDLAVIATFLLTGIRLSELTGMRRGDRYSQTGDAYIQVTGKGSKTRAVPISAPLVRLLDNYEESRKARFPRWNPTYTDPLFVDGHNDPLTSKQVNYLVKTCFQQAGLSGALGERGAAHRMRHNFATTAVAHGASAVEVQALLGHESLNTSQGYIQAAAAEVRSATEANPAYRMLDSLNGD